MSFPSNRIKGAEPSGPIRSGNRGFIEEWVPIKGKRETIRGCLTYPEAEPATWRVLLAGPHPFLGGGTKNNVVRALCRASAESGAAALTWEYSTPTGHDTEISEWVLAVSSFWETNRAPNEPEWLAEGEVVRSHLQSIAQGPLVLMGYSFGCWVMVEGLSSEPPDALVLVSPNPRTHELGRVNCVSCPLLVVHSDDDFACPAERVAEWFDRLREPKALIRRTGEQHFFRGKEHELSGEIMQFLRGLGIAGRT